MHRPEDETLERAFTVDEEDHDRRGALIAYVNGVEIERASFAYQRRLWFMRTVLKNGHMRWPAGPGNKSRFTDIRVVRGLYIEQLSCAPTERPVLVLRRGSVLVYTLVDARQAFDRKLEEVLSSASPDHWPIAFPAVRTGRQPAVSGPMLIPENWDINVELRDPSCSGVIWLAYEMLQVEGIQTTGRFEGVPYLKDPGPP